MTGKFTKDDLDKLLGDDQPPGRIDAGLLEAVSEKIWKSRGHADSALPESIELAKEIIAMVRGSR